MFLYLFYFFVIGLCAGSFANVCIHRIPRDESIVKPRSHCPSCNRFIRWYDNIPIASFISLGAKCRYCGTKISWQYPLIELITGLAFVSVAWQYAYLPYAAVYILFVFCLIVISGIDYFHQIIPDIFPLIIFILGVSFSFFNPQLGIEWKIRLFNSLLGAISGSGLLLALGYIGKKIFKQDAMGEGDIKLLCGIGALLGMQKTFSTLLIASFIGSVIGVTLIAAKRIQRKSYIPFGPFIAAGAYINLFLPNFFS